MTLTNMPLDRTSTMMIGAGSALLTYVLMELGEAYVTGSTAPVPTSTAPADPNTPPEKKKRKNLWQQAKDRVNQVWEATIKPVAIEVVSIAGAFGAQLLGGPRAAQYAYNAIHARLKGENRPPTPEEQGLLRMLSRFIALAGYAVVGACLLSAGWAIWLSLHPEVVVAILDSLSKIGEKAIDEISQIVDAIIPDQMTPNVSLLGA